MASYLVAQLKSGAWSLRCRTWVPTAPCMSELECQLGEIQFSGIGLSRWGSKKGLDVGLGSSVESFL